MLEQRFGVSTDLLDEWARGYETGDWPGISTGEISVGRPLMFGEELKPVTFKMTESSIAALDAKAAKCHESRSEYLRSLVNRELASV